MIDIKFIVLFFFFFDDSEMFFSFNVNLYSSVEAVLIVQTVLIQMVL